MKGIDFEIRKRQTGKTIDLIKKTVWSLVNKEVCLFVTHNHNEKRRIEKIIKSAKFSGKTIDSRFLTTSSIKDLKGQISGKVYNTICIDEYLFYTEKEQESIEMILFPQTLSETEIYVKTSINNFIDMQKVKIAKYIKEGWLKIDINAAWSFHEKKNFIYIFKNMISNPKTKLSISSLTKPKIP